ncbi:MAG: hypothetical protein ACYYK0_01375 [Candidatus Eutrophobiaceae bacterium]
MAEGSLDLIEIQSAAKQRNATAQHLLGGCKGVPQDYLQAHMWLNIAASSGVAQDMPISTIRSANNDKNPNPWAQMRRRAFA